MGNYEPHYFNVFFGGICAFTTDSNIQATGLAGYILTRAAQLPFWLGPFITGALFFLSDFGLAVASIVAFWFINTLGLFIMINVGWKRPIADYCEISDDGSTWFSQELNRYAWPTTTPDVAFAMLLAFIILDSVRLGWKKNIIRYLLLFAICFIYWFSELYLHRQTGWQVVTNIVTSLFITVMLVTLILFVQKIAPSAKEASVWARIKQSIEDAMDVGHSAIDSLVLTAMLYANKADHDVLIRANIRLKTLLKDKLRGLN